MHNKPLMNHDECAHFPENWQELLTSLVSKDLGQMPCNAIENVLPICPRCHDTKSVKIHSTVKIPSVPIYTLTCECCLVQWESNLTWRN